jgi:hypothetical protein
VGNVAAVEVQAAVDQFKADMKSAGAAFRQIMSEMGGATESAAAPLREHGNVLSLVSEKLREHRREHVQTARAVGAFTKELDGLVGKGNEVAGVLAGLAGGLAMGGALGLGIEAVKLLAEKFFGLSAEEKEAKKNLEDWFAELDKQHATALGKIQDLADKLAGISPVQKLAREQAVVQAQIEDLQGKIGSLHDKIDDEKDVSIIGYRRVEKAKEQIAELTERLEALIRKREDLAKEGSLTVSIEEKDRKGKDAEAAAKARAERAKERAKDREEEIKGQDEATAAIERRNAQHLADENRYAAEAERIRQHWDEVGVEEEEKLWQERTAALAKLRQDDVEARTAVEEGYVRKLQEILEKKRQATIAEQQAEDAAVKAAHDKALKEMEASVKHYLTPLRTSIDQVFTGLLDGQMNLVQVLDGLWKGVVRTIIGALTTMLEEAIAKDIAAALTKKAEAVSEITAEAGVAGAAAAAQTAAIPGVGPFMAIEAGEAMAAAVEAAFLPYASAAGGFDIPAGMNPVTQLHAQEMVLPAHIANPLRESLAGGGLGGPVHVTIHALDGADVLRVLTANRRSLGTVIRRMVRDGEV